MKPTPNHYQLLGVDAVASTTQIRAAYRRKAKALHPDVNKAKSAQSEFAQLAAAYEVLSDRTKRRDYDARLAQHSAALTNAGPAPAHYTWSNIATEDANESNHRRASEFDELYETFFIPHKPAE